MGVQLTVKQENFCIAFMETGNASEAFRRAYNCENMKPESINRKAKDMADHVKIRARMAEIRKPIMDKLEVSEAKTLKRLMQGQEFDIRRLYHPLDHPEKPGHLKHPTELDEDTAKAIVGVKFDKDTGVLIEYKVIDVKGCAEIIGKNLSLWKDVGSKENPLTSVPIKVVFGDDD
jgi:hypothetical protein